MITKSTGYQSSDGRFHSSLDDAQKHELELLINPDGRKDNMATQGEWFAQQVLENKAKILDILTTTSSSKPRGRKINGATRKRTPKHIAEQTTMFSSETPKPAA